ncbi:MAG TPA: RNA polymerase sigma-70 factor [Gemmatimonadales bacterium]|nr:RNA polymerase sigma-70 factor [Gemmatimonadales bacterium]
MTAADAVLFARVRAGDEAAFVTLFERYYDPLCAFARGYVASAEEAEEVVEDVFVRCWTLRAKLDIRESVKAYLYTATRNHALNRLRRARAWTRWLAGRRAGDAVPGMGQHAPDAEDALHAADFAAAIDAAIAELPERCRQVFTLHRAHGLTHAEIAATMRIAPKTVENQLGRALKLLRARLARYFDE